MCWCRILLLAEVKQGRCPKFRVILGATPAIQTVEVIPWHLLAFSSSSIFPIYILSEKRYPLDSNLSELDLVSQHMNLIDVFLQDLQMQVARPDVL